MKLFVLARRKKIWPLDELARHRMYLWPQCTTIMKCFDMDMDGYE